MSIELHLGDCLEVMRGLPDGSVNLIVTDPPYYKVKMAEAWDRQWKTPAEYLDWIGQLCHEWRRVLKPNGSLYVFASPKMAARVECKIGESFEVLNSIVWRKDEGWSRKQCKDDLRSFFPSSETIIFAEHFGADSMALGESGYAAQCEHLWGFVFEPLRAYLDGERKRAGVNFDQVREMVGCASGSGLPSHWFTKSQWRLPTAANYQKLREGFNRVIPGDYLRREYDYLRREYEDLRRPFAVSVDVPYTDVWDFATVPARPGKHPCEKPFDLIAHIIRASSRPGDTVLDCFAGSGVTGAACNSLGRNAILVERDSHWVDVCRRQPIRQTLPIATRRIAAAQAETPLFDCAPVA